MDDSEVKKQSKAAYGQWAPQWRKQALENKAIAESKWSGFKNMEVLFSTGVGKFALLVANGASFETEIETIKKHAANVDIVACDKTLGNLLAHGVVPKYCVVCDANVSYEKYLEPYKDQLSETILLGNVCGNPKWSEANWKDAYFFINEDIIDSHLEFQALTGCANMIIAGTNVSNAMLVMMTQCNNSGTANVFGYDRYLLIGFDYCWNDNRYYAFDKDGSGKGNYMRHLFLHDLDGDEIYSSQNLYFSAKWLDRYIRTFSVRAIQCSSASLLPASGRGKLDKLMQYTFKPDDSKTVKELVSYRRKVFEKIMEIDTALNGIERDHNLAALKFA